MQLLMLHHVWKAEYQYSLPKTVGKGRKADFLHQNKYV